MIRPRKWLCPYRSFIEERKKVFFEKQKKKENIKIIKLKVICYALLT